MASQQWLWMQTFRSRTTALRRATASVNDQYVPSPRCKPAGETSLIFLLKNHHIVLLRSTPTQLSPIDHLVAIDPCRLSCSISALAFPCFDRYNQRVRMAFVKDSSCSSHHTQKPLSFAVVNQSCLAFDCSSIVLTSIHLQKINTIGVETIEICCCESTCLMLLRCD